MVTRKKAVPADEPPQIEYADFVDTETLNPALENLKSQLGIEGEIDCTIHVSKLNADGDGNEMKVWQGNEVDYNLEMIAKKFGSGQYRVMVYVKRPDGQRPRAFNRIQGWKLSAEDQSKYERAEQLAKNPPPDEPSHNGSSDTREMMRDMLAGFRDTLASVMKPTPQADPLAMMTQLAGVMKTLMPAPAVAVAADPFTQLAGLLGVLDKLKGITKSDLPEGASATDTLLLEAARALLPPLAAGLQKPAASAAVAQVEQAAPPALPAPDAQPQGELTEDDEMKIQEQARMALFVVQLSAANRAAARKADPAAYAETIFDALEDSDIEQFALAPDWFESLCKALPSCAAHREWYTAVHAAVINLAVSEGIIDAPGGLTAVEQSGKTDVSITEGADNGAVATGGTPLVAVKS